MSGINLKVYIKAKNNDMMGAIHMNHNQKLERIDELLNEIRFSLPRHSLDLANIIVVEYYNGVVVLKSRFDAEKTKSLALKHIDKFVRVTSREDIVREELVSKNVVVDTSVLGRRGIEALNELVEIRL